jgi:glutamyl/glutaminyl-tRNA synthetase
MALVRYNTRFVPTVNGPLHVGHAYTCLVNEYEAHTSGGKFIVRFEDNQTEWMLKVHNAPEIIQGMMEDLAWLGIEIDEYLIQSEMEQQGKDLMQVMSSSDLRAAHRISFDQQPELTYSNETPYPYAPHLTAERVTMDYMSRINLLIRGNDLVSEYSLYAYFCERFGIERPRMVYIPRLQAPGGGELLNNSLSKTAGKFKIADFRAQGMSVKELLNRLCYSCLIDPDGDWSMKNIKRDPVWLQPG